MTRDITARKVAEERDRLLAREQAALERATDILESISDAFFAIDGERRFTYINGKAEQFWGCLGMSCWARTSGRSSPGGGFEYYRQIQRAMGEGVTTEFEATFPVLGAWGGEGLPSREGLSVYFQDVTERKRGGGVPQTGDRSRAQADSA